MAIPIGLCKSAAKKILEELSTILTNQYNLYYSFKDDFTKLKNDISAISAVLLDAEKKQDKSHLIQDWLMKLHDVLYDAEDLLDDTTAEALRQKVEAELKLVSLVRNMFFFSDMDDRIKKIIVRVDEIANRISRLNLLVLDQQVADPNRQRLNNTISYMRCCTEVVGRDEDKKRVIEMLLDVCSNSNKVVPIVGIGGTRHVSLRDNPSFNLTLPKLRTLLLCIKLKPHLNVFLSSSTYLRALDLSYMGITHLPNSIGNMKHLRYLNLNGNIELRFLPDSICGLHFLQTLKLSGCRNISTFPRNFSHLVSLRHLVITSPNIFEKQLGTLTSLRSLTIEHCRYLVSLTEVTQNLTCLRTLRIHNCAKLTSLPSSLKNCIALENLEVVNCPKMESLDVCIANLSSLHSLTIKGLPKLTTLPIKPEFYASSLQYLFIIDCISLMTLPDCMRNLSSLMRVHIRYCPILLNLPCGFSHLTALQALQIDGCPLLSTRCRRIAGEDWEKIAHVREIYVDNVRM
ncbi:hypothetical protein P8452_69623 [Trifolium repens]|nr:hypothetical protein P8452_69623 [Trifolium repens]